MPETAYYICRPQIGSIPIGTVTEGRRPASEKDEGQTLPLPPSPNKTEQATRSVSRTSGSEAGVAEALPKSYLETLKFWSRDSVNPDIRLKVAFLRPLVLFA